LATAEIHCPKCGSDCSLENKKNQYACGACETVFKIIEGKREGSSNVQSNHCPICGTFVRAGNGETCSKCGKENLCNECLTEISGNLVCRSCSAVSTDIGCNVCGKESMCRCSVCGIRRCKEHYFDFNTQIREYSRVLNMKTERLYSLYCPTCESTVCSKCFNRKEGMFRGGLKLYCKKCGSKLHFMPPLSSKKSIKQ
jgi:hypothetical protein